MYDLSYILGKDQSFQHVRRTRDFPRPLPLADADLLNSLNNGLSQAVRFQNLSIRSAVHTWTCHLMLHFALCGTLHRGSVSDLRTMTRPHALDRWRGISRIGVVKIDNLKTPDLKMSAFHEAGHVIVACHFGVKRNFIRAFLYATENPGERDSCFRGKMGLPQNVQNCLTAYQLSVIGWAGVIAERFPAEGIEGVKDSLDPVFDGGDLALTVSESDRVLIQSYGKGARVPLWKTYNRTFATLAANYGELERVANELMDRAIHSPVDATGVPLKRNKRGKAVLNR